MTISYDNIPEALRYSGVYIEIDGSQAGLGDDIPAVLLVGLKLPTGTAPAGEIVRLSGVQDAINKAGAGSMLAQMAARYRKIDKALDMYMLPYADLPAGVKATGQITVTSGATEAGVLALYIAQELVSVGIEAGAAPAAIATAIAAAITEADTDVCVTAAAVGAVVTLTARHKGLCGNDIDLRLNLADETTPAGLGLTLTAMSGGAGNPAPGDLTAILGPRWYRYLALGLNDNATMAAWSAEAKSHYQPPVQQGFRGFAAFRGDYAQAAAYGEVKNYEHITCMGLELNPMSSWEAAAVYAGAAAYRLANNPVESLEDVELTGMVGKTYFNWTQANSLLFKGISVMVVGKDGTCSIKTAISMYQYKPDGSSDDAYVYINTAETMERIRIEQIKAGKRFVGSAAAKSPEGYRPGLRITTEDDVRAMLLSLYKNRLMRELGWVQAYDYYKENLVVEQHPTNPSRFNFADKPVLLSPFYVLAGRGSFLKAVPSY